MGVGGLIQTLISFSFVKSDWRKLCPHKAKLCMGVVALCIYPLTFYTSMKFAGVAIGTVISIATAPFFSVILERLFSKTNNLSKQWILSFFVGMTGIILLVSSRTHSVNQVDQNLYLLGIILGFIAGLSYAIYSWVAKSMIDAGVASKLAVGSIFGLGALFLIPMLMLTEDRLFASTSSTLVLCYMAVIPMCLGYILFGYGLRHVEVSSANMLTLLEPVVAALLAVFVVGEHISMIGWLGIAMVITCLLLQSRMSDVVTDTNL